MSAYSLCKNTVADVYEQFGLTVVALFLLTLLTGLLDGAGMMLLLPLLNLVGVGDVTNSTMNEWLQAVFGLETLTPVSVMAMIVAVFSLQALLIVLHSLLLANTEAAYVTYRRKDFLRSIFAASWSFLAGQKTGSLVHLITVDIERIGRVFFLLIQLASTLLIALIYCAAAVYISWSFSLFMVMVIVVLGLLLVRLSYRRSYGAGESYRDSLSAVQFLVTDFLGGAKLIKATATENRVFESVGDELRGVEKGYASIVFIPAALRSVIELVAVVIFCALLIAGPEFFSVDAGVTVVLIAIFFRLMPKLYHAQFYFQSLTTYMASVKNVARTIEAANSLPDLAAHQAGRWSKPDALSIKLQHLTLCYKDDEALSDISFSLPANQTVAIVGGSGAGKSSIVNCLLGLIPFSKGDILVNGVSLKDIPACDWRKSVGYVDQEVILFNNTIRENILWASDGATDEMMFAAAKKAHIHHFIEALPDGYETVVGDRGVRLSGGQRQRLALARALVSEPRLLILDEATSALDSKSEKEVLAAIKELEGSISVVMIAHRLSTVRHADHIVVLEKGSVVEQGGWDELVALGEHLKSLWDIQR